MVVSSEEAIRDVLISKQDHFSDRPPSLRADILFGGRDVILVSNSPSWRYKKNHMMRAMKQHGDGLKQMEYVILTFGREMLSEIEKKGSDAFDSYEMVRLCAGSIIMALTYGYSTHDDVNAFAEMEAKNIKSLEPKELYLLLDIFPSLRHVFPQLKAIYQEVWENGKDMEQLFRLFTDKRKANKKIDEPKVFIDHFLHLLDTQFNLKESTIMLEEKDVVYLGADLLLAGVGTTSSTLYSLLGILVNYPSIQDKAYEEIVRVIGKRDPKLEDRQNMSFVEAIILEAHRYISLVQVLVPHYCTSDSELSGYLIPEGTMILANVWSLHHNENYWDQPWVFNPDRFIEKGKLVPADHINRQRVLNFGAGRRSCVGEIFAKNMLFILVTLLLQKFKFLPAAEHLKPRHDPREYDVRLDLLIKPYKVCVQLRN